MEKLLVELQDEHGNIYYLHTDGRVVFCSDGESVESKLNKKVNTADIINNCTSTATNKPLAAAQGKTLWERITSVITSLTNHQSSADHDGRYYTETEINTKLGTKLTSSGGDAADAKVSGLTANTTSLPVPTAGQTFRVMWGIMAKFCNDVKSSCFLISNIVNNCTSTATNKALSAAQGKALWDKYTQLNSDKVNRSENPLYFRGTITGNLNRTDIPPGYYVIGAPGTISNGILGTSDCYCQFIQFGDSYKTQMIIDSGDLHTRSYIGNPSAWTAWTNLLTSGNAAINTTYISKANTTFARWKKCGRMVTVELYDVDTKAGYSTDNVMVIATGLPIPWGGETMASLTGHDKSANKAVQVRLHVDSAGVLKPWYIGTSTVMGISGSFSYTTN